MIKLFKLSKIIVAIALTVSMAYSAEFKTFVNNLRLDYDFAHSKASLVDISADSSGNVAVFWQELKTDGYCYFKGRRFSVSGTPIGGEVNLAKFQSEEYKAYKFASSGRGNYLLATRKDNFLAQFQRFNFDLTKFDSEPVELKFMPKCAAIDNENLTILVRYEWDVTSTAAIYLYNRTSLADSIVYTGNYDGASGFPIPETGSMHHQKKFTLFFDYGKHEDYARTYSIRSRTLSYDLNKLEWISSFQNHFETENAPTKPAIIGSAGRSPNNDVYCFFVDKRLSSPGEPVHRIVVDEAGEKVTSYTIINSWSTDYLWSGYGFRYNHPIVFRTSIDSLFNVSYTGIAASIPSFFAYGSKAIPSQDYEGRVTAGIDRMNSVYLTRIGSDTLKDVRINGFDTDPLIVSSVINTRKAVYSAVKYKNRDSVAVVRTFSDNSSSIYDVLPAYGGYVYPKLALDSLKLAMVTLKPENSTDTSISLNLWRLQTGNRITSRNVSDNGVKAANPNLAIAANRICVVWEDRRALRGDTPYVYLQLYDTLGNAIGGNIALSPGSNPSVSKASASKFIVTFTYKTTMSSIVGGIPVIRNISNVYASIINSTGTIEVQPLRYNDQQNTARTPSVSAAFENGNMMLFWLNEDNSMAKKLYCRQITATGILTGSVQRIGTEDSAVTDYSVSRLHNTGTIVAWHDRNTANIKCGYLSSNGNLSLVSTAINERKVNSDIPVSLSVSGVDSSFSVTWINGQYFDKTKHIALGSVLELMGDNTYTEQNKMGSHSLPNRLLSISPNPFNGTTTIELLDLQYKNMALTFRVFDIQGKLIQKIHSRCNKLFWNGKDMGGKLLPTGIYTIIADSGHKRYKSRITILR